MSNNIGTPHRTGTYFMPYRLKARLAIYLYNSVTEVIVIRIRASIRMLVKHVNWLCLLFKVRYTPM